MSSNFLSSVGADELAVKALNGISYLSGGFGTDERQRLRSITKGDNLEISFALQNKKYLGGANVLTKDGKGTTSWKRFPKVLCFLRTYRRELTVQATAMGKILKQAVHVPSKGHARLYFAWNTADEASTQTVAQK
jgi:hypothetical protein